MATFRKRGSTWQVVVRRKGLPPLSKSFPTKADASLWARQLEHQADTGCLRDDPRILAQMTLGDLLRRYKDEITPRKRGRDPETAVLVALLRRPICAYTLEQLSAKHLAAYRDVRREEVGPATVNKDLNLIQHAIKIGQQEWGLPIPHNPVTMVRKLVRPPGRDRRLREGEFDALIAAARTCRNRLIEPVIRLAVETAMRRSELLSLRWSHIDLAARTAHLPMTKNGFSRTVPLTPEAIRILRELARHEDLVLPMSAEAVKLSWQRIVKKAGLVDLRFHDLRHEATSRFFEMGLNVPEVALITGHRDGRMLFRYTHLKAENVAMKLDPEFSARNFSERRKAPSPGPLPWPSGL
ncbi:MAG: site-specific integrase [Parvibaculaceae bacterium]|nr:site-specific integrase [Parvibaculaceae bacterium]